MTTILVGDKKGIMEVLNGIPKQENRKVRLEVEIPLKDIDYVTKDQLAVSVMNENQDRVEGKDVVVEALWIIGIDTTGRRVKVNVIDSFGQAEVEDVVFRVINNC